MPPASVRTFRELLHWRYAKASAVLVGKASEGYRYVGGIASRLKAEPARWQQAVQSAAAVPPPTGHCSFCTDPCETPTPCLVVPAAIGGPTADINIVPACESCVKAKGDDGVLWWFWLPPQHDIPPQVEARALRILYRLLELCGRLDYPLREISRLCAECRQASRCRAIGHAREYCIEGVLPRVPSPSWLGSLAEVRSVRDLIYWRYAQHIADSAAIGRAELGFVTDRYRKLLTGELKWSTALHEYRAEWALPDQCIYCGSPAPRSLDHLIARARGGPDSADNAIRACRSCNSSKGKSGVYEWYQRRGDLEAVPGIVEGKYLKLLYQLHEESGTLDAGLDDRETICGRCCSRTTCNGHFGVLCLESVLPA